MQIDISTRKATHPVSLKIDGRKMGTHIQGGETVPAENVFAASAHHLSAAVIPLDRNVTQRTAFDVRVLRRFERYSERNHNTFSTPFASFTRLWSCYMVPNEIPILTPNLLSCQFSCCRRTSGSRAISPCTQRKTSIRTENSKQTV